MAVKHYETKELEYTFRKECLGKSVTVKFPSMRKAKNFSIYPIAKEDANIFLQSETSCMGISRKTGKAVYSNKGSAPLSYYLQFKPTAIIQLPMSFVEDIEKEVSSDKRYNGNTVVTDLASI